jgi:hypothetical protein
MILIKCKIPKYSHSSGFTEMNKFLNLFYFMKKYFEVEGKNSNLIEVFLRVNEDIKYREKLNKK